MTDVLDALTPRLDWVVDTDSHEMVPAPLWGEEFGDPGEDLRRLGCERFDMMAQNTLNADVTEDSAPITYGEVWNHKGVGAPSAIDMGRRPEVLDLMGVSRQLVFPTFAIFGVFLKYAPNPSELMGFDPDRLDLAGCRELGARIVAEHNRWSARVTAESGGRVRPVGLINVDSAAQMIEDLEELIDSGVRAVHTTLSPPPAAMSPAAPALDPFWRLLADHDVPFVPHLGAGDLWFAASNRWNADVDVFVPSRNSSAEFPIEPHHAATFHFAVETFLCAMLLGGVFERHPTLRFGAIELSAQWVGPFAERMDMWAKDFGKRLAKVLSMRPSEYIARNVRVTPFYFEPVDTYFDRYANLADVFCFSTDFPHREGGNESKRVFYENLQHHDDDTLAKFFTLNGELLLPA